jgi:hypothetical protein
LTRLARSLPIALVALLSLAALTAVAFAAKPVKGAKYSGHVKGSSKTKVSFKVSSTGRKVTKLKVKPAIPSKCGSNGHGSPPAASGKIKHGKFKITIKVTAGGTKRKVARITGKFVKGRKEKGRVKPLGGPSSCGSFAYSTHT